MPGDAAATLRIEVAYSPAADRVDVVELMVPAGATVSSALQASGLRLRHPSIDLDPAMVGVWGRRVPLDRPLRDGDRVEVYRPLIVEPKEARRLRDREQRRMRSPPPR